MNPNQFISNLILPEFGEGTLSEMLANGTAIRLKSNQVLVQPGQINDTLYVVVEGGFVCRYIDEEKDIFKTINFFLPDLHPFMVCVDSFFKETPTHCELRAISPSTVLALSKQILVEIIDRDPQLHRFYHSTIIKALTEENDLKLKIIAYSSEDLYAYFLKKLPSLIQNVPSKYIAELMGISPEWLSKLKRLSRK